MTSPVGHLGRPHGAASTETALDVSSRRYNDAVVATPAGRVDHASADALQQALAPAMTDAGSAALVLDFTNVEYISSVGLRVLMMASKQLRGREARIAVAALQPVVREIFEIARFQHVVEVFPSVRDALAALSPAALTAFDAGAGSLAP
jgi:anti-sigma B factor antagonist/stage II sporulation protein AA (anti-sigma F factor antagonist)